MLYLKIVVHHHMSYEKLHVYKVSKQLALEIHRVTMSLPKFEMYEEGSQIRRSSKAITALIVEGYGRRRYKADFIKFLIHAHAECDETILHLTFLFETGSWPDPGKFEELLQEYKILSATINRFIRWADLR